ncbi:hypothetical protein [Lederbergia ruris]|uniref:hypothetical protein n=1 Tax=Lederbergia ruris TaxID=217495 RepID=UPI0039A37528
MNNLYYQVTLEFFEEQFIYKSAAQPDIDHLKLIFKNFIVLPEEIKKPVATFLMSDCPNNQYVRDVFDPLWGTMRIRHLVNGNWELWSQENTAIPPLTISPLNKRFLVLHGCAIESRGNVFAFCGPSFAGKSTLLLESINQGAKAVSDDLVVIEFDHDNNPWVWKYPKPVGVRVPTLSVLPWLPSRFNKIPADKKLFFPEQDGRPATTITNLSDIFYEDVFIKNKKVRLNSLLILKRGFTGISSINLSQGLAMLLRNTCNSGLDKIEVVRRCAQLINIVGVKMIGNDDVVAAARGLLSQNKEENDEQRSQVKFTNF